MERKVATVLFADVVDSTSLVIGTDPEVVRQRVNRYFEQVSHCIEAHGGTVDAESPALGGARFLVRLPARGKHGRVRAWK